MSKSLIILAVDNPTFHDEHPDGKWLTAVELERQGSFANADMAGLYGYESWSTVFSASTELLAAIAVESTPVENDSESAPVRNDQGVLVALANLTDALTDADDDLRESLAVLRRFVLK